MCQEGQWIEPLLCNWSSSPFECCSCLSPAPFLYPESSISDSIKQDIGWDPNTEVLTHRPTPRRIAGGIMGWFKLIEGSDGTMELGALCPYMPCLVPHRRRVWAEKSRQTVCVLPTFDGRPQHDTWENELRDRKSRTQLVKKLKCHIVESTEWWWSS